jgi:hypothetical protein
MEKKMTQLKQVQIHGMLKDISDNFAALGPIGTDVGLGNLRVARFEFDVAGKDSAGANNSAVGAHGTGVTLPAHAIIMGGFFDVNTAFTTSASGQLAIHVEGANDIQTATVVSSAPFSSIGRKAITPKANTPESTSIKTTVARAITCTVSVGALTAGKLTGYLYYVEGIASA